MKKLILILIALIPLGTSAQVKFEEMSINKAFERAKKENKGLVIDFISNRADKENIEKVLQDKATTAQLLEKFIPVRISLLKTENMEFYAEYIRNYSTPVLIFMNQDKMILSSGHWDELAIGREHFNEVVETAIKQDLVKKTNTRHINFQDIDYLKALEKAKATGKPVFIDCYFEGCGPCKKMDNNVFTLDRVADFYNQNFICIKLDRAKDEHGVLRKFKITGFPAHVFIKPTGDLILKEDGYRDENDFIALGNKALKMFSDGTSIQEESQSEGKVNDSSQQSSTSMLSSSTSASVSSSSNSAAVPASTAVATTIFGEGSVHFEKLSLSEAKAKAKSENKLIYVDLSATWCQPCKLMKQNVFPDPDVVQYLNKNYVSINFECDKDGALADEYRDKYYSSAFPTHLIIDKDGELIHKFVGYMKVQSFLEELQKGVTANKGLGSFNKRYESGERSPEFMNEYITMLANANEGERASALASEYLTTLPLESLANRKAFFLVNEFVLDLDSEIATKVFANRELFEKGVSKADIDEYERKLWILKALSFVHKEGDKNVLDKAGFETFVKRLNAAKIDKSGYVEMTSTMEIYFMLSDWNAYVNNAILYMKKYKGKASPMLTWNWGARLEGACKDKELRLKYVEELEPNYNLIKKTDAEQAIIWAESMKSLFAKLKN